MKARIRNTGEIVDVICYGGSPLSRSDVLDYVNYIDSQGVEHIGDNHLNYYWDFEPVENKKDHDLDALKNQAAIAAMQGTITILSGGDIYFFRSIVLDGYKGNKETYPNEIAKFACACADALIEELKKK